jgi:hypothetical protein
LKAALLLAPPEAVKAMLLGYVGVSWVKEDQILARRMNPELGGFSRQVRFYFSVNTTRNCIEL